MPEIASKRVLVTGACGTVGAELVRQLLARAQNAPEEVIGLDNNESDLFFLDQEYVADPRARFFVADIRDRDELAQRHGHRQTHGRAPDDRRQQQQAR